ncbi:unnamed protein product [Ilex paraguariensis]|uniref:Uncharacterized protein n=1 Tax=Ilex paraguariensis TaxID=185542 RepID=A0ABC8QNH0_9AQUA
MQQGVEDSWRWKASSTSKLELKTLTMHISARDLFLLLRDVLWVKLNSNGDWCVGKCIRWCLKVWVVSSLCLCRSMCVERSWRDSEDEDLELK